MLSYKEYKLLNESLYGAFNLGLRSHGTVGGIVSDSSVNGTEAALEAEGEEAIEEAKKGKKMKKKMGSDEMIHSDDEEMKKVHHDEEDSEDEDHEDEDHDEEDSEDEDHEDEDHDEEDSEDEDHDEEDSEEKSLFMKKKSKKHMSKKAKKEWSDVVSDLETILEEISDEEALAEIKKGLETIKEGMKKGMKKHMGCGTKKCGKYMKDEDDHEDDDEDEGDDHEGLTDAQKKLPPALRKAILAKKGKKKGKKDKKSMNEDEAAWWKSVNGMLGSNPNQKNWDGGWEEVGEVEQAVRENAESKKIISESWPNDGGHYDRDQNHGVHDTDEQSVELLLTNLLKQTDEIWKKSKSQVGAGNEPMMLIPKKDFEKLMTQIDDYLEFNFRNQ